jgi:hypothetical protein
MHLVEGKDGNLRSTTIADARKLQLVPSVTTILSVIEKPGLINWMIDEAIDAALTLTQGAGEPSEDFKARIKTESKRKAKEASEEGSRIHEACEAYYKNSGEVWTEKYNPHVDAVRTEVYKLFPEVTDWVSEKTFAHPLGFGGACDLHSPSTGIIIDFKSKSGDFSDKKKLAYDQVNQLAAYQFALGRPFNPGAAIFVSRTHPGCVASYVWDAEKMAQGWAVFEAALTLWKRIKGYDPSFQA